MMYNSDSQQLGYPSLESDRSASIQYADAEFGNKSSKSSSNYEAVIQREVQMYRLRYLCSQPISKFRQYLSRRTLHGSAVYVALFLMFLERLAYYAVVGNITDPFLNSFKTIPNIYRSLIQTALFEMVTNILFPIAGFLGDRYIGRSRTVHASMWFLLIGYVSLTLASSFEKSYDDNSISHYNRFVLPICFLIITIGSTGFQANMIPLGADQIIGRPSDEISSYFYWYYWIRNSGALTFVLNYICPFDYKNTILGYMATVCIALGLIVLQFTQNKLFSNNKRHNPYKLVLQVVKFVIAVKRPHLRSAFSYTGIEAPSRMDLAKEIHGGQFTNSEVEDVKTFLRLLVFLPSLVGVLTVYTGIVNIIATQAKFMNGSYVISNQLLSSCNISDSYVWVVNIACIAIAIPIINYVLYPFLREYTPNMRKRIGIGHILTFLSPLVFLVLSSVGFSILSDKEAASNLCMFSSLMASGRLPISSIYILIPHILISLAEVFIIVSSLEFFYAQSPHTMRGMIIGLFFFMWGIATVFANLIGVVFSKIMSVSILTCDIWYHMLLVVLAILSFILYVFVSVWYKNRLRGDIEPDLYYRRK